MQDNDIFHIQMLIEKVLFNGGIINMAVKIRLRRMGQKKNPIYRIVVADS